MVIRYIFLVATFIKYISITQKEYEYYIHKKKFRKCPLHRTTFIELFPAVSNFLNIENKKTSLKQKNIESGKLENNDKKKSRHKILNYMISKETNESKKHRKKPKISKLRNSKRQKKSLEIKS